MKIHDSGLPLIACPAAIVFLYLGCEGSHDPGDALCYIYPAIIQGLAGIQCIWKGPAGGFSENPSVGY